jgi:hypothetical protein
VLPDYSYGFTGVTFVGARAQIEKQLRTAGDLTREELWETSSYLARAVSVPLEITRQT